MDSGEPLMILDGKQLLGRALNVFGETIDRGKKINMEAQAGHRRPEVRGERTSV